jgi:hypothetical protein
VTNGVTWRRPRCQPGTLELLEERQNLPAPQVSANDNIVVRVDPMNLENRSGADATNRRDSLHSQPFRIVVINSNHVLGTCVPVEEPSTDQNRLSRRKSIRVRRVF